jgi:hypothetical protein
MRLFGEFMLSNTSMFSESTTLQMGESTVPIKLLTMFASKPA